MILHKIKQFYNNNIKKYFPHEKDSKLDADEHFAFTNRLILIVAPVFVFGLIIMLKVILIQTSIPKLRLGKDIKDDLKTAIYLNSDYADLKIIFDKKQRIDIRNNLIQNDNIYDLKVDLSFVLEDMIYDYYAKNNIKDSIFIKKLKSYLIESKEKHPFDILEESQKELFIKLRENSGISYHLISNDLISISKELNEKNETINTYLDKSNQSYTIAIIALFLTLLQTYFILAKKIRGYIRKMKSS
jgi:hypothetical protein